MHDILKVSKFQHHGKFGPGKIQ